MSFYDITGGQDNEEYGFGYLRSPYVISINPSVNVREPAYQETQKVSE